MCCMSAFPWELPVRTRDLSVLLCHLADITRYLKRNNLKSYLLFYHITIAVIRFFFMCMQVQLSSWCHFPFAWTTLHYSTTCYWKKSYCHSMLFVIMLMTCHRNLFVCIKIDFIIVSLILSKIIYDAKWGLTT